jgi:hypothetical protein
MIKKILLFSFLFFVSELNAQLYNERSLYGYGAGLDVPGVMERGKYFSIGYGFQSIESKETGFLSLKSDYATSLTFGKTFYLNQTPVLNSIFFGIDWTMLDLNFADYSKSFQKECQVDEISFFQIEAGMQVGPSVTIDFGNEFGLNAYFRYTPSFSGFYNGDFKPYAYNYAGFFVTGIGVLYQDFAFGVEGRLGKANYEFKTEDIPGTVIESKYSWTTKAIRIYISYRF